MYDTERQAQSVSDNHSISTANATDDRCSQLKQIIQNFIDPDFQKEKKKAEAAKKKAERENKAAAGTKTSGQAQNNNSTGDPSDDHINLGVNTPPEQESSTIAGNEMGSNPQEISEDEQFKNFAKGWLKKKSAEALRIKTSPNATHVLKGTHPDAQGSNLCCNPTTMNDHQFIGTWCLKGESFDDLVDVAPPDASLHKLIRFLGQQCDNGKVQRLAKSGDADFKSALEMLTGDKQTVEEFIKNVPEISTCDDLRSDYLAKQVYWCFGDDPTEDIQYHLLSPMYGTSLAHYAYTVIHNDGRDACNARSNKQYSADEACYYPNLAAQKLGGSNPINVSYLNAKRGGINYLLPSIPPRWESTEVRLPFGRNSVFALLGRQQDVFFAVRELKRVLESNPRRNQDTRKQITGLLDQILLKLSEYVLQLSSLPPGWSADRRCHLAEAERLWLDPGRCVIDANFASTWYGTKWEEEIDHRFANWLNHELGENLPMGDIEHEVLKRVIRKTARRRTLFDGGA